MQRSEYLRKAIRIGLSLMHEIEVDGLPWLTAAHTIESIVGTPQFWIGEARCISSDLFLNCPIFLQTRLNLGQCNFQLLLADCNRLHVVLNNHCFELNC